MKLSDLFLLSTRAFAARPMRTFLTILGVSVGIGAVLFLVSLGYGLQNLVLNKITTADALLSLDVSPGVSGIINLDQESIKKISEIQNVSEVSPMTSLTAQLGIGELTGDSLVYAVDASFFRLGGIIPQYGNVFNEGDNHGLLISSAGAKLFNMSPKDILNKEIYLTLFIAQKNEDGLEEIRSEKRETKYLVTGVVEDENTSFIYIPAKSIADLNINTYSQAKVKVSRDIYMEEARNKIIEIGFLASALSDTIDQAKKIFQIIQIILALFGLVALTVSAIGMFNTMTVTLLERINEIGIMRSIGASAADIKMLFLVESVLMGLLGGVGGIAIGYLGGQFANFGVNLLAKSFGGQSLNLFFSPTWFVGFILAFSTVIGFTTGIYPSRRASKLNPLEALRYK